MTKTGKSKDERTPALQELMRHVLVTFLAVAIMGFFAIITVTIEIMDPIRRTIADFSFTDIYYQIEREGAAPDTCRYITIVDMTKVTARGDIAKVLTDIEAANPKVVGLDCVFDNEGDDIEGNDAIIEVAEKYKNIVFAEKMLDWENDTIGYTKVIHSFFSEFVDINEGTVNMPRKLYDSMKRKTALTELYRGKHQLSFVSQVSNLYTGKDMVGTHTGDININFSYTKFQVLQPDEVKAHPELIEGQIVLFGSMYEDADMHWSPLGKIAGVELLAYSIQSLIERTDIKYMPFIPFCIITLLIIFIVQVLQANYLRWTGLSSNMFTKYIIGSAYVMNILTFLFTSVFIGISFLIFCTFHISFNLAWALSVIAFLGVSRSLYAAIKDYVNSVKDKYSFLKGINL